VLIPRYIANLDTHPGKVGRSGRKVSNTGQLHAWVSMGALGGVDRAG